MAAEISELRTTIDALVKSRQPIGIPSDDAAPTPYELPIKHQTNPIASPLPDKASFLPSTGGKYRNTVQDKQINFD